VSELERRRVDRVVEVGVADEHGFDLLGRRPRQMAVDLCRVREGKVASEDCAERDPRDVRVDEDRLALVRDAIPGDADPLELEAGR